MFKSAVDHDKGSDSENQCHITCILVLSRIVLASIHKETLPVQQHGAMDPHLDTILHMIQLKNKSVTEITQVR